MAYIGKIKHQPVKGIYEVGGMADDGTNQSIPTTTLTKVVFNNVYYNDGGNLDTTNERYVAPATGMYLIHASVGMSTAFPSGQRGIMKLYKNGAVAWQPLNDVSGECNTSTTSEVNAAISRVMKLNAHDYVEMYFIHFAGSTKQMGAPKIWLEVNRLS